MDNEDRIKALNILFTATLISMIITAVLTFAISKLKPEGIMVIAIISPVTTYIVGRILCFREYK